MSVRRVWEAPRVTLPYSELQWGAIDALGKQVDADLRRMDVRLTQGGEPTFVSVDDREGGEWNTEAMGPTKRVLSVELMERLRKHTARAASSTSARASGIRASSCRAGRSTCSGAATACRSGATPRSSPSERDDHGATAAHARAFLRRLGDARSASIAATSSPPTRTPATGSGARAGCRSTSSRAMPASPIAPSAIACADVFARGLGEPVGYALPIAARRARRAPLALVAVVSARRPLLSRSRATRRSAFACRSTRCRGSRPADMPWIYPPDPNEDLPPLADRDARAPATATATRSWHALDEAAASRSNAHETPSGTHDIEASPSAERGPRAAAPLAADQSAGFVVRTAISAEARHGRLYVFMPPTVVARRLPRARRARSRRRRASCACR